MLAFTEMLPGGFTPRFGGTVYDASIAGGVKGEWINDIMFDLSASYGRSQADFSISNTINPSMGPETPTSFDPGTYVQTEIGLNLDMFREFDAGFAEPLILAGGVEWREDIFEVKAGDVPSFTVGPLASQGFGIGSNGFPGFKPEAAGVFTRRNLSFYTDASAWITDNLMLNGALRYEDFTDFGDTTNWKVSALYNLTDSISLRAAAGTGFRAPTIGQSKVINVTTAFGPNGLEDQATLPPDNPISIQKGGKPLKPEESENFSLGAVMNLGTTHVSLDYYNIKVTDRLSQTSPLTLTDDDIAELLAMGVSDASSYSSILFFTNDFDTRTQGVDLVVSQDLDLGRGRSKLNLVFNWNDTEVTLDPLTTNVGETKVRQLEENLPNTRGSLSFTHEEDRWRALARLNYYGSFWEAHLDDGSLPIDEGSAVTVDLEFGYKITAELELVLGAQNAFNKYPDENPYGGVAGAKYPTTTPYGFNGGMYYVRAVYQF